MKKILNILMAALVLTGISCSEDLEYKPGGVTPVQTLLLPADNYYVELQSASTATLRFSWEPALAADGQLPHYEVVFFGKPGGEIVYRCDAGSSTSVDIPVVPMNTARHISRWFNRMKLWDTPFAPHICMQVWPT